MGKSGREVDLDIAPFIEHALLNPIATQEHLEKWCDEADRFQFATVCLYPFQVKQAVSLLHGKHPQVCAVIGFPTGASTSSTKLYEAQEAVEHGAEELDVMLNLSFLKARKLNELHREIAEICEETDKPVKAILEMGLLTPEEIQIACEVCLDSGVQFIKTHTGWFGGVTVEDIRFLKQATRNRMGIKAAGGIQTIEQAIDLILEGATRLGTSRGPDLLHQRVTLDQEETVAVE
ncbi:MAG: deoxyribose-phosphate aldolase [Leptolyngbyaceae cyanobacterium bins.59]|nr:deoxyribose-phosphate aldolase [Leptolyngbyaceae cyanobacterium bins.59]